MITQEQIKELQGRVETLGKCLDIDAKRSEVEEKEKRSQEPDFWNDPKEAEAFLKGMRGVKSWVASYDEARSAADDLEVLLQELERRLDNVVFRMGYANTRREARQLVTHGHFTVNGRRVNIPSYQVKPGEVIAVCEKSRASEKFKALIEQNGKNPCPKWIEKAADAFEGKIVAMPARDDIDYDVAEHLIVELYNK